MSAPDPVGLVGGAVSVALGVVLLLEAEGRTSLGAGWLAVALCAGIGLILVVSGLSDREREGGDGDIPG